MLELNSVNRNSTESKIKILYYLILYLRTCWTPKASIVLNALLLCLKVFNGTQFLPEKEKTLQYGAHLHDLTYAHFSIIITHIAFSH